MTCVLIGVHLRRGDFASARLARLGYRVSTAEYINGAMQHMRLTFNTTCLTFVVLGNDYRWNKENVGTRDDVHCLKPSDPAVDLCVLSKCSHSVVSTGTYSWWAAWLANGHTVYDKLQVTPNSTLAQQFNEDLKDYIPEHWIPL